MTYESRECAGAVKRLAGFEMRNVDLPLPSAKQAYEQAVLEMS